MEEYKQITLYSRMRQQVVDFFESIASALTAKQLKFSFFFKCNAGIETIVTETCKLHFLMQITGGFCFSGSYPSTERFMRP